MEIEILNQIDLSLEALIRIDTFLRVLQDFATKWSLDSQTCSQTLVSVQEAIKEINQLKIRSLRTNKRCVVVGKISTGKSTLINALLGQKLLPTGCGITSNCLVEIKSSPDEENYILMENECNSFSKHELGNLQKECKILQGNMKSPIKAFLSTEKARNLKNNFTIIDTPGIGNTQFESCYSELSREADLIILVISSLSEFSRAEKEVVLFNKTKYSMYNIIIVFNFWDIPNENDDFIQVRGRDEQNALDFLNIEMKGNDLKLGQRNVFFLSSLEELKFQMNDKIPELENRESRKEEFIKFRERLMVEVTELSYTRRMNILQTVEFIITDVFENAQRCLDMFKMETTDLVEKIRAQIQNMERFNDLNDQINKDVKKTFKNISETVIRTGKKIVEKKSDESSTGLTNLVKDIYDTENNKLKDRIFDLIQNSECDEFCKNILKEIYFERYFNNHEGFNKDSDVIRKNLIILNRASKIGSGIHTGFNSALGAASVASGGITVGAVAAVETATSIVGMISGKNLSIFGLFGYLAKPFHFIWDKEEGNIRKQFLEIEDGLKDSLKNFPEKVDVDIVQIMEPLSENFNILTTFVNNVKQMMKEFRQLSFIYI